VQVSNAHIQQIYELHLQRVGPVRNNSGATRTQGADQLVLSQKAGDIQQVKQKLASLPETRAGRVNDLRQKIQAGNYKVSVLDVAKEVLTAAIKARV
jgi:flagellar biosynthesis anti-sigma factor FlgM